MLRPQKQMQNYRRWDIKEKSKVFGRVVDPLPGIVKWYGEENSLRILKKTEKLIERRCRLAKKLAAASVELDEYLEKNDADFSDELLMDCTCTGCMIYMEPEVAANNVREYIKNKL